MNEIVDRLPPPPMLHWDERESDRYFGQLPLSGFEDVPVMAERVFIRLARRWHDVFSTAGSHDTPPRLADELALACLMLAREHDEEFTVVPRVQQERNIVQACRRAVFVWVDSMPWRIMQRDGGWELEQLYGNLSHHNSALRIWAMELGWACRSSLDKEKALPRLLENVAGTLIGVQMAWGLAGALFDTTAEFHAFAENWQPTDFANQYAERVIMFKKDGLLAAQAPFWKTESTCRRLIAEAAFM